jgi:uncharacterized protein YjiS (DUF1127 family)
MLDLSRTCRAPAKREGTIWFARAVAAPLHRWLGAAAASIARELRIRRDTRRLLEAEPRMLRDLGIVRGDVERLVRRGRDERG